MAPRVLTRELALYTLLSAVALAVDTGAFTGLLGMGAAWPWAAGVGFAAGLLMSYTGSTLFVFHQHRLTDRRTEFVIYGLVGVGGLALTQLSLWVWLALLHLPPLAAKLLSAAGVFAFNFTLRKILLFSRPQA